MTFALDTLTIHGFNRISSATWKSAKVFWSLIVLICFVFAALIVYDRAKEHLRYHVTQSVTRKVRSFLQFPVVTICNGLRAQSNFTLPLFTTGFDKYTDYYREFCTFGQRYCYELSMFHKASPYDQSCISFNSDQKAWQTEPWLWSGLTIDFFLNSSDVVPDISSYWEKVNPRIPNILQPLSLPS